MSGVQVYRQDLDEGSCLVGVDGATCDHANCAEARRIASASCTVCGAEIGFAETFHDVGEAVAWQEFAHQRCLQT